MSNHRIKMVLLGVVIAAGSAFAQLFHEQASATSNITYSSRCFSVNGKPTWIFAGEVEYWRIPRELWRDRLMRVKRAGYNTVSSYVAWNLHEPVQGQLHWENNLDLDAWLALIKSLGMYAIVRAGPYICAEVDFGGFPPWLVDIPNIQIRGTDTSFLKCVYSFWGNLFPIITKYQITAGGPVIAVQIENEYYPAGGAYETDLVGKAQALGMVVPYIWSSVYNGGTYDPGLFPDLSTKGFMTEQWMGWISRYGPPGASDANSYIQQTWRMAAEGTGGTSQYMAHGGTNFGYTASLDQRITSYDYGAQIGELGQLRPVYWSVKQTGWLANTFSPLLANSTNDSADIGSLPSGLTKYVQKGTAGKAAFVMNGSSATTTFTVNWINKGVTVPSVGSWSLDASMFAHFLADVPITANATLDYSATGILCWKKFGAKNFLVLYGSHGNTGGDIAFVYNTPPATAPASPWTWNATAKRASLRFTYPTTDTVNEVALDEGAGQTINLLIVRDTTSNKTYMTDSCIVTGAEYLDENNKLQFTAAGGRAFVFSAGPMQIVTQGTTTGQSAQTFSSGWTWIASPEVGVSYNDSLWQQSTAAQDMTYYGWPNGYGWYRAKYTAASAGTATLAIPNLEGNINIFVNGVWAGAMTSQSITLQQGVNQIAILACAAERDKLYMTYGFTPPVDVRSGIWGNVTIGGASVGPWRFRGGFQGVNEQPMMGNIDTASWTALLASAWSSATPATDHVARLWRQDFSYTPPVNGLQTWTLNATVDSGTSGVVWLNGHCLGRQIVNQDPLFVPQCWLSGNNTLIVLTQQGGAPKSYSLQPVEYRSFAGNPTVGTIRQSSFSSPVQRNKVSASLVISGKEISLPRQFAGKEGRVAIYDLRGNFLDRFLIRDGKLIRMRQGASMPNGVFIARIEE